MSSTLSVKDVAERYGVGLHTVLGWIERGELRAINVGRRPGGKKPRWRMTEGALAAFEGARSSQTSLARLARRKRAAEVIAFY
jgi:excisionase family DNA binding protein